MPTATRSTPDTPVTEPRLAPLTGPYVGLRPYEAAESDRFFGRDRDAMFLCNKILSARLTILYSQSGLGKSSLLRTLVIPRLKEDGEVIYFDAWSQDAPLAALKDRLAGHASSLGVPSPDAGAPTLTELARLIRTEDPRPLTLVLDQFEEFLISPRRQLELLRAELAELTRTTQIAVQIVLSLREEFLAALEPFRQQIVSLFQSTYRLEPLDAASLRDAIRLPPRSFNGSCDEELVEVLIRDLESRSQAQPESTATDVELPMLQLVCSELWNLAQRTGQSTLTVALYQQAGGVNTILDRYVSVSMPASGRDRVLAALLMRLLAPPSGVKMAYSAADLAENVGSDTATVTRLLEGLARARILQPRHSKRGSRYELQHDAFIRVITPWRDRVLTRRSRLRQLLVTISIITTVVGLVVIAAVFDRSYRSTAARQSTLRDLINHVENDLEARPTFNLLLATTAHMLGLSEEPELQGATESALRRALASVGGLPFVGPSAQVNSACANGDGSKVVTAGDDGVSIWDIAPSAGDLPGLKKTEPRRLTNAPATQCAMNEAGTWLVTTSGGHATLWDLQEQTPQAIAHWKGETVAEPAISFSADGKKLAVGLEAGVEVWNVGPGSPPVRLMTLSLPPTLTGATPHAAQFRFADREASLFVAYEGQIDEQRHGVVLRWTVSATAAAPPVIWWKERTRRGYISMALGEAANWLGALTVEDEVRVADLVHRAPSERMDLTGLVGREVVFAALAFGRGDKLAVADRSGGIGLWSATSKTRDYVLLGHDELVNDLSFTADGRWIVSASHDGMVRRWDLGQIGTDPWSFGVDGGKIRDLAFFGQRPWLVTAGSDGIHRFDLASKNRAPETLAVASSEFGIVDVSQTGQWLAAGRHDGRVLLWDGPFQNQPPQPTVLAQFKEEVSVILFSPDSQWLAAGSDDKRIQVWQLKTGASPQLVVDQSHAGEVTKLSFSPDSLWLAAGSAAGDVVVWRLRPDVLAHPVAQGPEQRRPVTALAFDRQGHLAIALDDGKVSVWDANTRQQATEAWEVRMPDSVEYVSNLAFSPDGRSLVAGTSSERLLRWPMVPTSFWTRFFREVTGPTGQPKDLGRRSTTTTGTGAVRALVFSTDGRLATGFTRGPVTIATIDGPPYFTELWRPKEPQEEIWKLAFSGALSSDRFIGAIADDGRAWVWNVASDRLRGGKDELIGLACRAAAGRTANQTCNDLKARLSTLPNWDVCGVCAGSGGR